jgi:hypothetical protein
MDIKDQATSLAVARIVVGAAAWVAPERSLRASLLDGAPQSTFLLRLFGARDAALGAITLLAAPSARPTLLKVGMAVDGADAAAAVMALKSGAVRPAAGAIFAGVALTAVAAGAAGIEQQKK